MRSFISIPLRVAKVPHAGLSTNVSGKVDILQESNRGNCSRVRSLLHGC